MPTTHRSTTPCHCEAPPTYDPDWAFEDDEGFVCTACDSNVYYNDTKEN